MVRGMTASPTSVSLLPDVARDAIVKALGEAIVSERAVPGGDINVAVRVRLASGREIFVKTHASPEPGMYRAEAAGLAFLAEAGVCVPAMLDVADSHLALEFIAPRAPTARDEEALGQMLAALHQTPAPAYGMPEERYLGPLVQRNEARDTWPRFYAEQRLLPLTRVAARRGLLSASEAQEVEALARRLDTLLPDDEGPRRIHGDLWSGNVHYGAAGPYLIDPAAYGGHREVDLAMMQLFGGFSARVFGAYDDALPRAAGHAERVPLYQLYPLLAHVCLFGRTYVAGVKRVLSRYG